MTPEQAEHLRDLFFEARKTTRATASEYLTALGMQVATEEDDAAVDAFNAALREATS